MNKKSIRFLASFSILALSTLFLAGCNNNNPETPPEEATMEIPSTSPVPQQEWNSAPAEEQPAPIDEEQPTSVDQTKDMTDPNTPTPR